MKLMSEQGVSSVAIVEDNPTAQLMNLLSAVSVTDIGKVCAFRKLHYIALIISYRIDGGSITG